MSDTVTTLAEITRNIIREFIDHPDKLKIDEQVGKSSVIIGIASPEKDDISQIIGRGGNTIVAIKKIIERIAHKRGVRCTIYVVD